VADKKTTGLNKLLFGEIDPYGAVVGEVVSRPIERFPLDNVRPDPEQPRRLLPNDLALAVNRGDMDPPAAMREWIRRSDAEPDSGIAREMRELQRLASAIAQHGLINPITIRPSETEAGHYLIVTGERRYWAHVLLTLEKRKIREGVTVLEPNEIKATLVPAGVSIRAHQIVENLMREDINVIEKAHGLLALRQELSNDAYRRHQESGGPVGSDEPGNIPWKQVEDSLDISRQYRLRIVSVLELTEEAQQLVDRYNLAEATIRPVVEKLKPYPDLQVKALQQIVTWQEAEARGEGDGRQIVLSVRALVDRMVTAKQAAPAGQSKPAGPDFNKLLQQVRGTLRVIEKLDPKARADLARAAESKTGAAIVTDLQALRDEIDQMLAMLAEQGERREF
jgi:hypothetical protein